MLIGAHVSPAGGLPKAIERGLERDCRAIQIFNQSPRMWRPTTYEAQAVEDFRKAMADSQIDAVLIHERTHARRRDNLLRLIEAYYEFDHIAFDARSMRRAL